jgi:hypothetical protein
MMCNVLAGEQRLKQLASCRLPNTERKSTQPMPRGITATQMQGLLLQTLLPEHKEASVLYCDASDVQAVVATATAILNHDVFCTVCSAYVSTEHCALVQTHCSTPASNPCLRPESRRPLTTTMEREKQQVV